MTRVCLIGLGRTGIEIARALVAQRDIKLVAAIGSEHSSQAGNDIGSVLKFPDIGAKIYKSSQLNAVIESQNPDVFVDFSNYKATLSYVKHISESKAGLVIGTTGFSNTDILRLKALAKKNSSAILYAPNITVGVNVMMLLSNIAALVLPEYDFEINEAHHKHKKDSPSGTAIKLAGQVGKVLANYGLDTEQSVPIHAVRAGGIVGKHELIIAGENDKIEISHESFNRSAFAEGALRGVRYIKGKKGFIEMQDVLELEKVFTTYFEKRKATVAKTTADTTTA